MQGIAVFRRNASFSWLRLARLISFFGDIVTATALVIHIAGLSSSPPG